ncbi:hypothetical protein K1T71_007842 [Dendrolimus kikuchii]|uniref:Uncharacterized protein n=1 Tax=Dendrolimus kikuchii TaxID=765133 RepID=A0ACC1CYC8_9NEOP|nr:hypothetical protein K1T71_007842 [Dendrolimus kikuchii]
MSVLNVLQGCELVVSDYIWIQSGIFTPLFCCIMVSSRRFSWQRSLTSPHFFPHLSVPVHQFSPLLKYNTRSICHRKFLIMQQTNPVQFYFEVIEHNEFKRLVHLSLKTGPATDADIKRHMSETIITVKKSLSALKSSSSSTEALLNDKCINMERKIHDLSHAISKMEEDKARKESEYQDSIKQERERLAQERLQWQKNADINMKTQLATSQENLSRKDRQIEEMNSTCKHLRERIMQLENQISEKSQRINVLEKEVQKTHIEVATLKAKNASLDREIAEKDKQCSQQNNSCTYLEKVVKENAETIKELNSSLQIMKKEKASLEERLSLSESLINKNNEAVHTTSEQLLKANQIISKQNADLIEMKEKLLCRTAIALEQEKVIENNVKEMDILKTQIAETHQNMDKLLKELDNLKQKYESTEQALKDRDETIKNNNMVIQWLHKKLEDNSAPIDSSRNRNRIQSATSSTPYFLSKNNATNSSHGVSDESIDFYATSKLSNAEDSPGPQGRLSKVGLDPKYLKPASVNDKANKVSTQKNCEVQKENCKENINTNLPRVDYREKKSAKSTYRATPISAYFP